MSEYRNPKPPPDTPETFRRARRTIEDRKGLILKHARCVEDMLQEAVHDFDAPLPWGEINVLMDLCHPVMEAIDALHRERELRKSCNVMWLE